MTYQEAQDYFNEEKYNYVCSMLNPHQDQYISFCGVDYIFQEFTSWGSVIVECLTETYSSKGISKHFVQDIIVL